MDGLRPRLHLRGAPSARFRYHQGQEPRDGRRREEEVCHEAPSGDKNTRNILNV